MTGSSPQGEIYPTSTRAKQMSMSTASNWLWSESGFEARFFDRSISDSRSSITLDFGIGYATPYLVNTGPGNAGLQGKVFFIVGQSASSLPFFCRPVLIFYASVSQWGGACVIAFLFVYFVIPETKGLSLEQGEFLSLRGVDERTRTTN